MSRMSLRMVQVWPWYLDIVDTGQVGLICVQCGQPAATYEAGIDSGTRFTWADLDIKIGLHIGKCERRPEMPEEYEQPQIEVPS